MMACIRNMYEREYPLLKDFLYEAIYIPEGVTPPPKSVVEIPELQVYIADFDKQKHDKAMVAEVEGKVIGAVWARIMQDYGHIDDDTPSLSISLYKQYRGQGIGTALLTKMLYGLKEAGYKQASLSVQKANDAVRLYQRLGFETVGENTEEYIMKKQL